MEHLGFRLLRGLLLSVPEGLALGFGGFLGWVMGSVLRIRRSVVEENIARAFPRRDRAWRRRIAAASYRHLGREAVATFRLAGSSSERVRSVTRVEGLEALEAALAEGRGVVMVAGHLGNWEMGGAALAARGLPVDAVVQVQRNPRFDEDLRRARERLGIRIMSKQSAPRAVLQSLREGHLAALVADQNVVRGGVFVDFFGTPAATARGPAVFALRTGAPLWAGVALKIDGGRGYRVMVRPVSIPLTGDQEEDVRRLTRAHLSILESWIEEAPEQYFWLHKRWKSRPPIPEPAPGRDDIS
ncbi:MAG: lysophospholipid acyltransferase family protein [Gemmatimonadales bacterium]|nr:MAG: lysophospholipid acyltransferase family protein [Gemmatimonadales bacterium]